METTATNWSAGRKLLFRFLAIYFLIYCLFNFMEMESLWTPAIEWLGRKLKLFTKLETGPNGSGDTTYNYLQLLYYVAISLAGCVMWSIADRKRRNYEILQYWFLVMLRYTLGFFMVTYGMAKVFKTQFPTPFLQLLEPYGEASPMGLAWTFMGYSTPFNVFTGMAEIIGGILVLFRRTSTFGALFSMTVMTNVVAMNFCYDIPVKLFSMHLLLLATLIAWPDAKRLVNFFFLNRPVGDRLHVYPVFQKRWMRITRVVLKSLAMLIIVNIVYESIVEEQDDAIPPPLYGIYAVDEFYRNNVPLAPLTNDSVRWRYFAVSSYGYAYTKAMTDKRSGYDITTDTLKKTIQLISHKNEDSFVLNYTQPDKKHLILSGKMLNDSILVKMTGKDPKEFNLLKRGFHWVNEYPYNK